MKEAPCHPNLHPARAPHHRRVARSVIVVAMFLAVTSVNNTYADIVWRSTFTFGADGVVDMFDGNPGKVMIGPASGGDLQITTWDTAGLFNGDRAGRPLGATLGGEDSFSALYEFSWSGLNTESTNMWESVGFLGNNPNQTRQICGAILRHWRIPDGRYWVAVDVAFGGVGLTSFGFNAGTPILLGTSPFGVPYRLAIGYQGETHVLSLDFFNQSGVRLGGQKADLDTDVAGLQGGVTGDPAQEIGSLAVTHIGWSDYTAHGEDRETVWQVDTLTYYDTFDGAYLAAGGITEVTGACCLPNGLCGDARTEAECAGDGGIWQGTGTICTTSDCTPDEGACCLPDDTCIVTTFDECYGVWKGDLTDCETSSCPPPWVDPTADEPWEVIYSGLDTAGDHTSNDRRWDRIIDDDWDVPGTSYMLNTPFPGFMTVDRVSNPSDQNRTGNIGSRDLNLRSDLGLTLETRVLIRENSQPDSFTMYNLDDAGSVGVQLSPNQAKVGELPPSGDGTIVSLDTTDAFHLYRMVRMPNSFEVRLYVDNNPTPVATGFGEAGFYVNSNDFLLYPQVLLGDNSNNPSYNASYVLDFVRYRRGASAPGEIPPAVPPRVLPPLPTPAPHPETWAFAYTGDTYPRNTGWDESGSAFSWFPQSGGVTQLNTLSSNPANAVMEDPVPGWTNTAGITLEARILVFPNSEERGFNLVINDRLGGGSLLLSPDKAELSHPYLPGGFATFAMDTTNDFHTYRITRPAYESGTGKGLFWHLYIDNEPVAAIAHQKSSGTQLPYTRIVFGDVNYPYPENGCNVLIDYIQWREGSSAPIRYPDLDRDSDVDLQDVAQFQNCVGNSADGLPCIRSDFDGDFVIDVQDWHRIEDCIASPGVASAGCHME